MVLLLGVVNFVFRATDGTSLMADSGNKLNFVLGMVTLVLILAGIVSFVADRGIRRKR